MSFSRQKFEHPLAPEGAESEVVHVTYLLTGERGAVHYIEHVAPPDSQLAEILARVCEFRGVQPVDLGYHSPRQTYSGQRSQPCRWLESECFCDGSALNAEAPCHVLHAEGEEALWAYLESYYHHVFDEGQADGLGRLIHALFGDD